MRIARGRTSQIVVGLAVAAVVACGGTDAAPRAVAPPGPSAAELALDRAIEAFYEPHLAFRPTLAIELGRHDLDGRVPDRSRAAIEAEIARLHDARRAFEAIDAGALPGPRAVEREVALAEIRRELFDLEVRRRPWRDPFWYLFRGFSLAPYVVRDYAPLAERGRALLAACEGGGAYWQQARANLEAVLPRAWLQAGAMIGGGTVAFLRGDAKAAFAGLGDADLRAAIEACLDRLAGEVAGFVDDLTARVATADDRFAIGQDALLALLREAEGLDVELATLRRLVQDDLARNQAALAEAAAAIDPTRDVRAVVAEVTADKPAPDEVIAVAAAQVDEVRRFVVDRALATIPRDDALAVRPSPPFMRGNFAALSSGGPFEPRAQPSFYYIAPPDPAWPEDQQRAYVMSRADLLFVTAHETWPGHFLQNMHAWASGSRVLQTFETYTTSEEWAHYVEEMLWDEGLGGGDPRARIGMLKNALLRDVRFLVNLEMHAGAMTVDEAAAAFEALAYADPQTARQQAMRGTVDPMFLGYTLGKLAIRELRDDWRARFPDRSLGEFHDAFLRHGEAPLPVIRRMLLGPDAKPPFAVAARAR